ncbi:MAG TPA: serine hydrolase [Bacteroidales bacterium]
MKARTKKRLILLSFLLIIIALIVFPDTYTGRYIRWFLPDVYDLNKFPFEKVENCNSKLKIPNKQSDLINKITFESNGNKYNLSELINNTKTNAFIILHNDTIIYENYAKSNSEATLFKAFSATKSVLSALIGIAIDEGKIKSIDEPVKNYVTGFKDPNVETLTIKQCLMETTGVEYNTSYLPWGGKPQTYYRPDIRSFTKKTIKVDIDKQNVCDNSEHNINILGMVIENATNQKIYDYLSEKIWKSAGMSYFATFSIDSKKNKYAYVTHGLNATAKDFLIFGKLFLDSGLINGKQIISKKWIKESTSFENGVKTQDYYKNYNSLWWIMRSGDYSAFGHFGQRIYISPRSNTVIVRFGEKSGGISWEFDVFPKIIEELNKNDTQHGI